MFLTSEVIGPRPIFTAVTFVEREFWPSSLNDLLHCVRQSLVIVPGAGVLIGRSTENVPSLFAAEFLAIGFDER